MFENQIPDILGSEQTIDGNFNRLNMLILYLKENVPAKIDIHVTRANIFEDSFRHIMAIKRVDLLKTK